MTCTIHAPDFVKNQIPTDLVGHMPTVIFAYIAHKWRRLARVLETRKLDELLWMVGALRRLTRLLRDQHASVTRQRSRVVRRLSACNAQVRGACDAVERCHMLVVFVTCDAKLTNQKARLCTIVPKHKTSN